MTREQISAWACFKEDVARYLEDYQLSSVMKLPFIIDFWPVVLLRLEGWSNEKCPLVRKLLGLCLLVVRPLIMGITGTRILSGVQIRGGLLLHAGVGVVITSRAVLGRNCTLFSGVSVAHKANSKNGGAPVIGDNVKLMSGCKIIGNVKIGNNAIVGANAVVLQDVPENCLAVGIPAKVKKRV